MRRLATVATLAIALMVTFAAGTSAGGTGNMGPASARWEPVSVTVHPQGLDSAASAYDPATGELVVFGGETSAGVALSDTWLWSGSTWSEVTAALHPPALTGAAMAYDPKVKAVVMFGGIGQYGTLSSETWLWKTSGWHLQGSARAPSPRSYPAMAYDAAARPWTCSGDS